LVELTGVSKTFKGAARVVEAVRDVSISVAEKEIMGIIGHSGAGKSTLVRCINLLEKPDSGRVVVDGRELSAMDEAELRHERRKIGMIFQLFNLMRSRTVFENIAYPLRGSMPHEQIAGRITELLELVDMSEKRDAYPSQLSGGQKQRVAIARALANHPKVLLCDEATSALDPQTTRSILRLLRRLNETLGITIVVITHEMGVVKEICDRVAVMEQGRIVEEGDVVSVFSAPKQNITKEFISTTSNLSRIYDLLDEKSPVISLKEDELLVKLMYIERNVSEPLISGAARRFDVDFNIIFSDVEIIRDAPLGGTISILSGGREKAEAALSYLREKNVYVEVIADGRTAR
jgi:D-methionine transport system ATP-binding protein